MLANLIPTSVRMIVHYKSQPLLHIFALQLGGASCKANNCPRPNCPRYTIQFVSKYVASSPGSPWVWLDCVGVWRRAWYPLLTHVLVFQLKARVFLLMTALNLHPV